MTGGDGGAVEKAKAHRGRPFGVMAGRARGDEGVGEASAHHFVDRESRAAGRMHRRLQRARRHHGVGVEARVAFFRRSLFDGGHIGFGMHAQQGVAGDARRLMAIADKSCGGRVVSLLEGGYDLDGLSRSVAVHLSALMEA